MNDSLKKSLKELEKITAEMDSLYKSITRPTEEPIQKSQPSNMGLSHSPGTMLLRIRGHQETTVPNKQPILKAVASAPSPVTTPLPVATPTKEIPWGCPAPIGYKRYNDLSGMTGAQRVAIKCGLDPNTPGIEKMSLEEMKALSYKLNKEELRRQYRKLYGWPDTVDPLPDRKELSHNYVIPSHW